MKINLIICFTILLLCNSCSFFDAITPDECPDHEYGQLSDIAKGYVPYQEGDSVFFKDKNTGELYYLTCKVRELKKDSFFFPDEHCENEGYYDKWEELNVELISNFPYVDNTFTKITIHPDSRNNFNIHLYPINRITFKETDDVPLTFYLKFNSIDEKLGLSTTIYINISYKDSLVINNREYFNIAIISNSSKYSYDTIYYNKNGILKLISSKYRHYLEIME